MTAALFFPDNLLITPGALERCKKFDQSPLVLLERHLIGDWGDLDEHDRDVNDHALKCGSTVRSWFQFGDSPRDRRNCMLGVWIVTSPDRRTTTITTPEED